MQSFVYVQKHVRHRDRGRIISTHYGIAKENGVNILYPNIHYHACTYLYEDMPKYEKYLSMKGIVYLQPLPSYLSQVGDIIVGELDKLLWIFVRKILLDEEIDKHIDVITNKCGKNIGC